MDRKVNINRSNKCVVNYEDLTKEELIARLKSLEAHNFQLKNIISKSLNEKGATKRKNNKSFDFSRCSTRHILLKILYLGWNYQGFTVQENTTDTIEHFLFEALERTCLIQSRTTSDYHRCGRTDKGVSSFAQVISITVRSGLVKEKQDQLNQELNYCKLLNRVLPKEIQCIAWKPVPDEFSARFDCKSRTYKYFFPKGNLNIENMQNAANYLLGVHDFRNLCKMDVGNGVVEFIRNVSEVNIEPIHSEGYTDEYNMFVFTIRSGGFLWHQIRCVVGILFLIGQNRESPEIIQELLDIEKNPCKPDYNMASEVPLNLYSSEYETDCDWQYDSENLTTIIENLRKIWSFSSIKSSMLQCMIENLVKGLEMPDIKCLSETVVHGVKPKNYIPLMKRPKCDSLEKKLDHYVKRKKLILKKENEET